VRSLLGEEVNGDEFDDILGDIDVIAAIASQPRTGFY